jgi:hypothetical protein
VSIGDRVRIDAPGDSFDGARGQIVSLDAPGSLVLVHVDEHQGEAQDHGVYAIPVAWLSMEAQG